MVVIKIKDKSKKIKDNNETVDKLLVEKEIDGN